MVNENRNQRRRLQFEVFKGEMDESGNFKKVRLAGIAFLREGTLQYKLKVFSQIENRFYVLPDSENAGRYKVLVRDEVQFKKGQTKIYWCDVGDGRVLTHLGLLEIKVDLWSEPLYMSIFPREFKKTPSVPFVKLGELKLVA